MKYILITLLLSFALFSALVKADESYQYEINAEIFSNNTVHYNLSIIATSNSSQNILIPIGTPSNIIIAPSANCKEQKDVLETFIDCSLNTSNKTLINIEYDNNDVTKKDSYFLFSDSVKLMKNTKTISFLVKLPEGTGLKEPIEGSYSPTNALIGSDGRRPIINWVENDLKAGDSFDVSIAFESIGGTTASFPFVTVLAAVVITFSALGLFYQFYLKGKNIKLILPVLKKDEKIIFDAILKNGSGVNQKTIVRDSGYSKAKVSKVLNSLKERGLVSLERIGRSNKVHIEKNFEKKSKNKQGNN